MHGQASLKLAHESCISFIMLRSYCWQLLLLLVQGSCIGHFHFCKEPALPLPGLETSHPTFLLPLLEVFDVILLVRAHPPL